VPDDFYTDKYGKENKIIRLENDLI
jgi:hypothetical protein